MGGLGKDIPGYRFSAALAEYLLCSGVTALHDSPRSPARDTHLTVDQQEALAHVTREIVNGLTPAMYVGARTCSQQSSPRSVHTRGDAAHVALRVYAAAM